MVNFNKMPPTPSPQYAGSQSGSPQNGIAPATTNIPQFSIPTAYPPPFTSMSPESYYDSHHDNVNWNNQYSYQNYLQHHVGIPAHPQMSGIVQPVVPSQNGTAISMSDWSGDEGNNGTTVINNHPSPTMTICGSEGSSPRAPSTPQSLANNNNVSTANNNNPIPSTSSAISNNNVALQSADEEDVKAFNRQIQARSPYEWMKRTSYQNQPNPGKTRTKDKYRVVYTDHQRLELEKEFHFSRYITIRRKAELAQALGLSERQVKIWFQNRRAKDRKLAKKANEGQIKESKDMLHNSPGLSGLNGSFGINYMPNIMPTYSPHPPHLSGPMHMPHHPSPSLNALHAAAGLPQHQPHHQHAHHHQQHSMMQYPVTLSAAQRGEKMTMQQLRRFL